MTRSVTRLLMQEPILMVYLALLAAILEPLLVIMTASTGNITAAFLWTWAFLGSVTRIDNWLVYDKPTKEAPAATLGVSFSGSLAAMVAMICTIIL